MSTIAKEYTPKERVKIGRNAGIVGIVVNLLLFAAKLTAGLLSGSVAIIADAANNLSDAGSSVIVMVSYILSGKPADKEHPYGHARFEYLSSLFISIIVTMLGFELFRSSIDSIRSGEGGAVFGTLALVIMGASVLTKLALAIFFRGVGRRISSAALEATAMDCIGDVVATGAVIVGMLLSKVTGPKTDGVIGCIIAAYIFCMGLKLIKESSDTLLGVAPDPDIVGKLTDKLRSYEGVLGIHDLIMHNYGEGRFFASVHVEVDSDVDVSLSHERIDAIELDIKREMDISLVIHMDPICINDPKVAELHEKAKLALRNLSKVYGRELSMHDFRVVFGVTRTNLIFDVVAPYDLKRHEQDICGDIDSEVKRIDPSLFTVVTVDRDYTSTL